MNQASARSKTQGLFERSSLIPTSKPRSVSASFVLRLGNCSRLTIAYSSLVEAPKLQLCFQTSRELTGHFSVLITSIWWAKKRRIHSIGGYSYVCGFHPSTRWWFRLNLAESIWGVV